MSDAKRDRRERQSQAAQDNDEPGRERRRVTSSTLRRYAAPRSDEDERRWVTSSTLRRYIDVSAVTLWRWRQDPTFPPDAVRVINGRNFFDLPAVEAYLVAKSEAAA